MRMSKEEIRLVTNVFNMLGLSLSSSNCVSRTDDKGIVVETGKPNINKLILKAQSL